MTANPGPGSEKQSLGDLIGGMTAQFSTLVRGEIELAQVQLKEKVSKLGLGGGLLAAAGVLALYMLGLLLLGAVWGLGNVMPLWAAFLVVSGILLVIIAVLGVIGVKELQKSNEVKVDPATGLKATADAAKKGLQND